MPLRKCPFQSRQTFDQFYRAMAADRSEAVRQGGRMMLRLIDALHRSSPQTEIWGVTSHYTLCLQTGPELGVDWQVSFLAFSDEVRVEYRMPEAEAPWRGATVVGIARDFETALSYIRIAMIKSGGWPSGPDLLPSTVGAF